MLSLGGESGEEFKDSLDSNEEVNGTSQNPRHLFGGNDLCAERQLLLELLYHHRLLLYLRTQFQKPLNEVLDYVLRDRVALR